jgi:hypothetical protein
VRQGGFSLAEGYAQSNCTSLYIIATIFAALIATIRAFFFPGEHAKSNVQAAEISSASIKL